MKEWKIRHRNTVLLAILLLGFVLVMPAMGQFAYAEDDEVPVLATDQMDQDEELIEEEQPEEELPDEEEQIEDEDAISIEQAEVVLSESSFVYNGQIQTAVIESIGGMILEEGLDYEASWQDAESANAGPYTILITGIGAYTGTTEAVYTIEKADNPMTVKGKTGKVIYNKVKKADQTLKVSSVLTVSKPKGTVTYSKKSGNSKILINKTTGKVTVKKGIKMGTYSVTVDVRADGGNNYNAVTKAVTFKVWVTNATANTTLLKKGNTYFDVREEAGQKLYQYDTLQGACANKGFAYVALYNRDVEKCKIVKVDLATLRVVKVSAPLRVYHANNLTYNTKKNLIVATACRVKDKRAVFVNPNTLKVVYKKDIKLTKKVKNLPSKVRKHYKGFTAIAYNQKKNCYVGRLRGDNNVIIFNGDLKPVRYVKLSGKRTYLLNQGMESVGDYIYDVRSFKGKYKYSMVTIHTFSGKYVGKLQFAYGKAPGNELECIFHDGKQFYAGFYYSTSQMNDTEANHVVRINRLYKVLNLKRGG